MKTRAIYKGDMRFDECPVFELRGDKFYMLRDVSFSYDKDVVLQDDDFMVFTVDVDHVVLVD